MPREWARLCKGTGFDVEADEIDVRVAGERRHRVRVEDDGEAFRLVAVVAKRGVIESIKDIPLRVWRRNRATQLVGFRTDERGRLVGEAWVPKAGISPEEFATYVRQVAGECDRLEYLLTGRDVE